MPNNRPLQDDAAQASDMEQATGHGGNLRDAGRGAEPTPPLRVVGNSGHIPLSEELIQESTTSTTGSPGADADAASGAGVTTP